MKEGELTVLPVSSKGVTVVLSGTLGWISQLNAYKRSWENWLGHISTTRQCPLFLIPSECLTGFLRLKLAYKPLPLLNRTNQVDKELHNVATRPHNYPPPAETLTSECEASRMFLSCIASTLAPPPPPISKGLIYHHLLASP